MKCVANIMFSFNVEEGFFKELKERNLTLDEYCRGLEERLSKLILDNVEEEPGFVTGHKVISRVSFVEE